MRYTGKTRAFIALSISIAAMSSSAAFAKSPSPQEKALLAASATAPLKFTIPISQEATFMGQAQVIITRWSDINSYFKALGVGMATNNLIRPADRHDGDPFDVGFTVIAENSGNTADVTVSADTARDKDADTCAHLLAYELEQYVATLLSDTTQAPSTAASVPALPSDVEEDMNLIRTQIATGDYTTALSTIDSLKASVLTKQNQAAPK